MKALYQYNWGKQLMLLLPLLFTLSYQGIGQSASYGNTNIASGGEMAIINVEHSFLYGSGSVSPGIVTTDRTSTPGYLSFVGSAFWSGVSDSTHVDGYVRTYRTGIFTFPIGNGKVYRPAVISTSSATAPTDAAYFKVNPTSAGYTSTSVGLGVSTVSTIEYWDINGTTKGNISLTWDKNSGITNPATLQIVGWDAAQSKWINIPASNNPGTNKGTITTLDSIAPNTYSVYTLASSVTMVACPTIFNNAGDYANPQTCGGTTGTITIRGLVPSSSGYTINYLKDGVAVTRTNKGADISGYITIDSLGAGAYTNIKVSSTACSGGSNVLAGPITLTDPVSPAITLGAIQNPDSCGKSSGSIKFGGLTSGTQYILRYFKNGTAHPSLTFTAGTDGTHSLDSLSAGTYTNINVTATGTGCVSNSLVTQTLVNPALTISTVLVSPTDPTTCSGNDGTFTVSGLVNGTTDTLSYYKDGIPQTPIVFTATGSSYKVSGLVKGSYTNISVNSSGGCISNTPSVALTLKDPSAATITVESSTNPTTCGATDGSFTVNGLVIGTSYKIKFRKNGLYPPTTIIVTAATSSSYTITGLGAGTYDRITASTGLCNSNALSLELTNPGATVIALGVITDAIDCSGESQGKGSVEITGLTSGTTYALNYVQDGGALTPITFTAPSSGTYLLTTVTGRSIYTGINVTPQGGCVSNSLTATIRTPSKLIIDALALDATTCSTGTDDGAFIVTGLSQAIGVSYTLSYKDQYLNTQSVVVPSGNTSQKVTGLTAGTYYQILVTDVNQCISNTVFAVVDGPITPAAPVLSKATISNTCPKNTADLTTINANTPPAGYTLEWHNATPLTASNKVVDSTSVGDGTYYATFFNATTMCYGATSPVSVTVTVCSPDLVTTATVPSTPPVAGQSSLLTITVKNTGTASTSGQIQEIITIPKGTSFFTFLSPADNNGWTCSATTDTTAKCTNSAVLVATTGNSTFSVPFIPSASQIGTTLKLTGTVSGGSEPPANVNTFNSFLITTDPVRSNCPFITNDPAQNIIPSTCGGSNGSIEICNLVAIRGGYTINYSKGGGATTTLSNQTPDIFSGCIVIGSLGAGIYSNIMVSSTGCPSGSNALSVTLSDPARPAITLRTIHNPSACGNNDGFIQYDSLKIGVQYTLNYSKDNVAQPARTFTASAVKDTLKGLTAGSYTNINVTNTATGCVSNILNQSLADPATAIISIVSPRKSPTSCSGTDGAITISGLVTNTAYTLSYTKDGVGQSPTAFTTTATETSYTVNGLIKGIYNISVSNGICISNSVSDTLSDPSAATITLGTPTNPSTCGSSTGTLIVSGLVSGTTYTLKFKKNGIVQTAVNVVANSTSYTISQLGAGSYTDIFVSNAGCNSNSLSQELNDLAAPVIAFGTTTQPTGCGTTDGSVIITGLTSGSSYTLNYVKDGIAQASQPISGVTTYTLLGLGVGNYTGITVTQGTCISNSLAATLSTTNAPIIDVLALDAKTCTPGNEGGFIVTGLLQKVIYTLNYMIGSVAQPATTFNTNDYTTFKVSGLSAGAYSNISISQGGCISNKVQTVVLAPSPAVAPVLSKKSTPVNCPKNTGDLTTIAASNAPAGYSLEFHTASPASAGNKVVDATSVVAGTYYATFYNATTMCYGASSPVNVTATPTLTQSNFTPTGTYKCKAKDGIITICNLVANSQYSTSYKKDTVAQTAQVATTDGSGCLTLTGLSAGTYDTFVVTNQTTTCSSSGGTASVNISDPQIYTNLRIIETYSPPNCGDNTGYFILKGVAGFRYYNVFYKRDGVIQPKFISLPFSDQFNVFELLGGNYTDIIVKDSITECASSNPLTASLLKPSATITAPKTDPTTCSGNDGTFTVNGLLNSTAYTLKYTKDGVDQIPIAFTSSSAGTYKVNGLVKGIYTINVLGSCTYNTVSDTLRDPSTVSITLGSPTNPTTCGSSTGSLIVNGLMSGTTYTLKYKKNGISQTSINVVNSTSYTISSLGAGSYTDIFVSNAGCNSNNLSQELKDPLATAIAIGTITQPTGCGTTDGSVRFTGLSSGTSYTLNYVKDGIAQASQPITPADTSYTIPNLGVGNYTGITVTTQGTSACISNSLAATLSTKDAPVIDVLALDIKTCSPSDKGGFIVTGLSLGIDYTLNYTVGGVQTSTTFNSDTTTSHKVTGLAAGTYSSIAIKQGTCISNIINNVVVGTPATPTLTTSNFSKTDPTTCTGTDGTITIRNLVAKNSYSTSYSKNGANPTTHVDSTDSSGLLKLSTLSSGTYNTFVVTNVATTCSSSGGTTSLTLSDPASPKIRLDYPTDPSACGKSDGYIVIDTLITYAQYTLNYSKNGVAIAPMTILSQFPFYQIDNLTAGNYTNINVTTTDGCVSNSLDQSLSDPTVTITVAKTNPTTCSGDDGTFTVNGLANGTAYTLSYTKDGVGQTPIAFTTTATETSYQVNGFVKGNYTFSVNSAGCTSNSVSDTLRDSSAAIITLGTPNHPSSCGSSTGSLTVNGLVSGITYTLKYKKNGISQTSVNVVASSSSYTISGLGAGSYTDIFVSNAGCNSNSLSQELKDPLATAIVLRTITQPTACNDSTGSVRACLKIIFGFHANLFINILI